MTKIACRDYGFDCDFESIGEIEQIVKEFGEHTDEVHGIDYSKEALMQVILRKTLQQR